VIKPLVSAGRDSLPRQGAMLRLGELQEDAALPPGAQGLLEVLKRLLRRSSAQDKGPETLGGHLPCRPIRQPRLGTQPAVRLPEAARPLR
jgi:hypothetical protein